MNGCVPNESLALTDANLLGTGGEGRVYRSRDCAVKIYHPLPAGLDGHAETTWRSQHEMKLAKLRAFPPRLPPNVASPKELVIDARGDVVGFTMALVPKGTDVMRLGQRRWREGSIDNARVVRLFQRIHETLRQLHGRGVTVGDLNDGNVLFAGTEAWFIDADSMQFGAHPCVVGHERFLDPRLYGKDLSATPSFTKESDWYAFAVMLFTSLLYVHPYGGQHKSYPTLLRRAEAGHSVLRADVACPRAAVPFAALPDDWLHWFEGVFDHRERGRFPEVLFAARWTRCACGLEHARSRCPGCSAARAVPAAKVSTSGACRATTLRTTRGRILFATMQGGLKYLVEEDGIVRREDGSRVLGEPARPGTRFAIAGSSTWVAEDDRLVRVHREQVVERCSTNSFRGAPAFDASSTRCFHLVGDWLLDATSGTRIGQVVEGQTFIRVGEHLGFGVYQTGSMTMPFVWRCGQGGITDVALPRMQGRLLDLAAFFSEDHALVMTATEKSGQRAHTMALVQSNGAVVAQISGSPEDRPVLASLFGKCVAHGSILAATDDGLLLLRPDAASGSIVEEKLFKDTRPFVAEGKDLLVGPGGSVYVIGSQEITQLSLA